ncbi:isoaspartyl peptidase/L-asparaginase [Nostoc ellipsosporum NOK]|nr:isoaspartyl peptidase/L-asparaginase [Nostoc ellipsosporum NOK]
MRFSWIVFLCFLSLNVLAQPGGKPRSRVVLVIHGGAGVLERGKLDPLREREALDALNRALDKGYSILDTGGSAMDAVEQAVRVLEDDPSFNAGRGAVFTSEGRHELDASIMNGKTLAAGAVAGVTTIRNPISAARAVMEKSPHVMLAGRGAEEFARQQGLQLVDNSWFSVEERRKAWQAQRQRDSLAALKDSLGKKTSYILAPGEKFGTVGAVALDANGNLAAATSTGGMSNKRFGRIGDSPVIGAGTYADNKTAAISGTGWGEFFIRLVLAKSVCDRMELAGESLEKAAHTLINEKLPALGGDGGLIAVDKNGNIAMPFSTPGMFRGYLRRDATGLQRHVMIYKD